MTADGAALWPLGWGIVGTGGIAATVGADIARLPDARIVAVSSRTRERADEFARTLGAPSAYDSVEALAADPAVDIVYVATPHGHHHPDVRNVLLAGKSVLCEKALTVTVAEAEDLVALARERHVFLMEAMWLRFDPLVLAARGLAADGAIGEVRSVSASLGFNATYDPAHRLFDPAAGGGAVLDLAVYPVSMAQFVLGTPDSTVAHGALAPNGVDIEEALLLRYHGGRVGQVFSSLRGSPDNGATIVGSTGRLVLDGPLYQPPRLTVVRAGADLEVRTTPPVEGNGYLHQLREVQNCVRAGLVESPTMPWADSIAVMRVLGDALEQLGVRYPPRDPS